MRRRPANIKFHLIAVALICTVITVLYSVLTPKEVVQGDPQLARGDRYIQVYSATWGENCNPAIDKMIEQRANQYTGDQKNLPPLPEHVETDNVLPVLSTRCDGRLQCQTPLSAESLEVEPLGSCFKRLKLSYRCFTIDRLWEIDQPQGSFLQLDCRTEADASRK